MFQSNSAPVINFLRGLVQDEDITCFAGPAEFIDRLLLDEASFIRRVVTMLGKKGARPKAEPMG